MKITLLTLSIIFILFGCKPDQRNKILKRNSFHIFVSDKVENELYEPQSRKFDLGNFSTLYYGNKQYDIDKMSIRGQTSLNYRRKNFSVNIHGFFPLYDSNTNDILRFEKFVLSSMSMDYTYIENKISHDLLKKIDLWPLLSFYTEVIINNHHQGLYLFIENLKEFAFEKKKAKCILRRGYNHHINDIFLKKENYIYSYCSETYNQHIAKRFGFQKISLNSDPYTLKFDHMYDILLKYKGKELYDSLNLILNLDKYLKKIATDEILENGDYTDEIYFYSTSKYNERITFDIIPWDYDDIFSTLPHEIGRKDTLCGRSFGIRNYPTSQDFLKETKGRLVFSIEDDLDYTIMRDDYLYCIYLKNLDEVIKKFDEDVVTNVFDSVEHELMRFYQIPEVIKNSIFDAEQTNLFILKSNINEKKKRLKNRLNWLQRETITQKQLLLNKLFVIIQS